VCGVVVKQELAQLVGSAENWFAILHQGCSDSRVKTVERYRRLLLVVGAQDVDVDGCLDGGTFGALGLLMSLT